MSQTLLILVYLAVGAALGGVELGRGPRTAQRAGAALVTVVLWPLWAPFVLSRVEAPRGPITERVASLLDELSAARSDAPCAIAPREAANILRQVAASERRSRELEQRLGSLVESGETSSAVGLHELRSAAREELATLCERERQALSELLDLCEILRDRRELSRHGPALQLSDARDDLRARVLALRELP